MKRCTCLSTSTTTARQVLVDPQGAELDLHRDFQEEFHTSFFSTQLEVPGNAAGFLMRHGIDTDKKLKLEEYAIKPKNALFVLGTLAPNPGIRVSATPVRDVSDDPIRSAFHLQISQEFATSVVDSLTRRPGPPESFAERRLSPHRRAGHLLPRPSACKAANLPPMRST